MFIDAEKWLRSYLSDGKFHELKKLQAVAKEYGLVKSDLKEARKRIGVLTEQEFSEVHGSVVWGWRLKK